MKELINENNLSLEYPLIHQLNSSLPKEINIYNQAFLILDRPLIKAQKVHFPTDHELILHFQAQGELSGSFICLLDTYKKSISEKERGAFLSLYTESMNILLGRFLSTLDSEYDIMTNLDAPKVLQKVQAAKYFEQVNELDRYTFGYTLISNFKEYDCRIIYTQNPYTGEIIA